MSKYKILLKITGSIAVYKSAYLISKLIQNGCEVRCAATQSAMQFIGNATLEGLTGTPVYTDGFERGEMMSHINLVKWADLTIVVPASGNTINKLAAGIADNLVTSLFLVHDWSKPYLIVPAMNTSMYNHPSTQASLRKLEEWKVVILPTDEGYLACGDIGKGKLLEPDKIFEIIMEHLQKRKPDMAKGKILITSGGTKENIDGVRYISNLSTGRTGSSIANYFSNNGWDVTFLLSENSVIPLSVNSKIFYTDYNTLKIKLLEQISSNFFDAIIHLAAVSDFKVDSVEYEGKRFNSPLTEKIPSSVKDVKITLTPTSKLVDGIKQKSKNEKIILTAFKFTTNTGLAAKIEVDDLFNRSNADFIVLNHPSGRTSGCEQRDFQIFDKYKKIDKYPDGPKLAEELEKLIISRLKKIGDSNASLS